METPGDAMGGATDEERKAKEDDWREETEPGGGRRGKE